MELLLWWIDWFGGCAFVDQADGASLVVIERAQHEWALPMPEGAFLCASGARPRGARNRPQRLPLPLQASLDQLKEPHHDD